MTKILSLAAIAAFVAISGAQAQNFRCEHSIDLPNSCSINLNQATVDLVNYNVAQVSCFKSAYSRKTSWAQPLYVYSVGEPINVTRSGYNNESYPTYMWVCPSSRATKQKQIRHEKKLQTNEAYRDLWK